MAVEWVAGLLGALVPFLLAASLFILLAGRLGVFRRIPTGLGVAALWLILVIPWPFGQIYPVIRGLTGELSLTSITFLLLYVVSSVKGGGLPRGFLTSVLVMTLVSGAVLYPTALGVSRFDLYRLGYGGNILVPVLCLLSGISWFRGERRTGLLLPGTVLAWRFGFLESSNLWDYLIDPWLFLASIAFLVGRGLLRSGVGRPAELPGEGGAKP